MTVRVGVITFPGSLDDGDALCLGEQFVGDLTLDGQFEPLADADSGEVRDPESRERAGDGLPLGVQQFGLGHDVDDDGGHVTAPSVAGRGLLQSTGPGILSLLPSLERLVNDS